MADVRDRYLCKQQVTLYVAVSTCFVKKEIYIFVRLLGTQKSPVICREAESPLNKGARREKGLEAVP